MDTAYWGFLGVGTMLDIFQNITLIPYFEYDVLSLSGYGVLSLFLLLKKSGFKFENGKELYQMIDTPYSMEVDTPINQLNHYAVLDRKLDTPYPMEVDTPYSAID
ncbi:hypothetical protein Tco_0611539 [Tanacetum coccineum]